MPIFHIVNLKLQNNFVLLYGSTDNDSCETSQHTMKEFVVENCKCLYCTLRASNSVDDKLLIEFF